MHESKQLCFAVVTPRVRCRLLIATSLLLFAGCAAADVPEATAGGPAAEGSGAGIGVSELALPPPGFSAYIAMGDSFAAANGVENEGPPCYNGKGAWPYQVGAKLTLENPPVVSVACSGATTAGITGTEKPGIPPQIDALKSVSSLDGALITITIGGNDVGVAAFMASCLPLGDSCATDAFEKQIEGTIDGVSKSLVDTFNALKNAAPKATIVAVGYPHLFLADQKALCTDDKYFDLDPDERAMIRRMVGYMNTVIAKAATDAKITSITKEVEQHFEGKEMCKSPTDGYFHFLNDNASGEGQFHPNKAGIAAYAAAVLEGLPKVATKIGTVEPENPPNPDTEPTPEQEPTDPQETPEQEPSDPQEYPEEEPTDPEEYPEEEPTDPQEYPEEEPTEEYPEEEYPEEEPTEEYPEEEPTEEYPEEEYPEEEPSPFQAAPRGV